MIRSLHFDADSSRLTGKRYGKAIVSHQGCFKTASYFLFHTAVYRIGNVFDPSRDPCIICICYRHIDRRNGIFLIIILRQSISRFWIIGICHVSRCKCDLRWVILHDDTVCCTCNALCIRNIPSCISTSDIGDTALKICGKGDLCQTIYDSLCRILCCAGSRCYGIRNFVCPTAILRHRNIYDQTLFPDDPVKDICSFLPDGNFTDDRLRLIPLHSKRRRYRFIARCIHCLERISMYAFHTVVIFCKYGTGCCGYPAYFCKIAFIHFAIQFFSTDIIGIGQ